MSRIAFPRATTLGPACPRIPTVRCAFQQLTTSPAPVDNHALCRDTGATPAAGPLSPIPARSDGDALTAANEGHAMDQPPAQPPQPVAALPDKVSVKVAAAQPGSTEAAEEGEEGGNLSLVLRKKTSREAVLVGSGLVSSWTATPGNRGHVC